MGLDVATNGDTVRKNECATKAKAAGVAGCDAGGKTGQMGTRLAQLATFRRKEGRLGCGWVQSANFASGHPRNWLILRTRKIGDRPRRERQVYFAPESS